MAISGPPRNRKRGSRGSLRAKNATCGSSEACGRWVPCGDAAPSWRVPFLCASRASTAARVSLPLLPMERRNSEQAGWEDQCWQSTLIGWVVVVWG